MVETEVQLTGDGRCPRLVVLWAAALFILTVTPGGACGYGSALPSEWAVFDVEPLTISPQCPSIAVDQDLGVHVAYYRGSPYPDLVYALKSHDSSIFTTMVVDAIEDNTVPCADCMIATGVSGDAHIAYSVGGHLRYASSVDGTWSVTNLSSTMGARGEGDIAVDRLGRVHIVAADAAGDITHFMLDAGTWTSDPIDGYRPECSGAYAIALDGEDGVHLCFYGYNETGDYGLWYANGTSGDWTVRLLSYPTDDSEYWGRPCLALSQSDDAYFVANANYRTSVLGPASEVLLYRFEGEEWVSEAVSLISYVSGRAVAVDSEGDVHILLNSYTDAVTYAVYLVGEDHPWAFKTPPPTDVFSAAVDSGERMHVVSIVETAIHSSITYVSNSYEPPTQPLYVTASAEGTAITLEWSPPESNGSPSLEGYNLYLSAISSQPLASYDQIVSVQPNATEYMFTCLSESTRYYLVVTAVSQLGEGDPSAVVTVLTGSEEAADGTGSGLDLLTIIAVMASVIVCLVVVAWLWARSREWP